MLENVLKMLIDALNCTIFDGGLESGYLVLIIPNHLFLRNLIVVDSFW